MSRAVVYTPDNANDTEVRFYFMKDGARDDSLRPGDSNDRVIISNGLTGSESSTDGYHTFTNDEYNIDEHQSMLNLAALNSLLSS